MHAKNHPHLALFALFSPDWPRLAPFGLVWSLENELTNDDALKNWYDIKNEEDLKKEEEPKNNYLKNEDDQKRQTTSEMTTNS